MLSQILPVCKPFAALATRKVLSALVDALRVVAQLAGNPEPFGAQ